MSDIQRQLRARDFEVIKGLTLSLKAGEVLKIGENVYLQIQAHNNYAVTVKISAPPDHEIGRVNMGTESKK